MKAVDRSKFVGGSDIAAVLGISPWQTPYELWHEKVHGSSATETRVQSRGKWLEGPIIDRLEGEFGYAVLGRNVRYASETGLPLSCEIDFRWWQDNELQNGDVKTVHPSKAREWGEEGTDAIPEYYTAQFLFGMRLTGAQQCLCAALIGADDLRRYTVPYDAEAGEFLEARALEFWRSVEMRTPPAITTLADVSLAFGKDAGTKIQATPELEEMVERMRLLSKGIAGDQAKADLLELDIKKYMADNLELLGANGKKIASWKSQSKKSYTVAASECRVFRTYEGE